VTVPYIYPLSEARARLSHLVKGMIASDSGPALMGQYGRPQAVLVAWDLFDHMRDLLSELEVARALVAVRARTTHPSGATYAPLSALSPTSTSNEVIRFWPDVVSDLRTFSSPDIDIALEGIAAGTLTGQPLADAQTDDKWSWLLVTSTHPTAHYLIWRLGRDDRAELVAVLPAGEPVTRAWQPASEPEHEPAVADRASDRVG
jgi:hypothetical protein